METAGWLAEIYIPGEMEAGLGESTFWQRMLEPLTARIAAAFSMILILVNHGIRHPHRSSPKSATQPDTAPANPPTRDWRLNPVVDYMRGLGVSRVPSLRPFRSRQAGEMTCLVPAQRCPTLPI